MGELYNLCKAKQKESVVTRSEKIAHLVSRGYSNQPYTTYDGDKYTMVRIREDEFGYREHWITDDLAFRVEMDEAGRTVDTCRINWED